MTPQVAEQRVVQSSSDTDYNDYMKVKKPFSDFAS